MVDYKSDSINNLFKRYEMLSNSLSLIKDEEQKNNIYFELNKLLNRIIEQTNVIYEEKFKEIDSRSAISFDEEKTKLTLLIDLINDREQYLNSLLAKHYIFTSKKVEEPSFVGKLDIDKYNNKIEIINNYLENLKLIKKYNEELEKINYSIELAKEKISISNTLNNELEVVLRDKFTKAFEKYNCFKIKEEKDDIYKINKELEYVIKIAQDNIKISNSLSYNNDLDESVEYEQLEEEYAKIGEKVVILELLDIYDKKTDSYEELVEKRSKINDIINKIPTSNIYYDMIDLLKEQYDTLMKQKEDINTLKSLEEEKKHKSILLEEKVEENNSDVFKEIIDEHNDHERQLNEKKMLKLKEEEENNRRKILEEQNLRKEEIKKRQKLIEEERKKDMEERAKKILEEQNRFSKKEQESDLMVNNPLFQEIKNESRDIKPAEETGFGLNGILPDDLDNYIKKFDLDDNEAFVEDKIFLDF